MRQILIDYLSTKDRTDIPYKAVESEIIKMKPLQPNDSNDFFLLLENINSDNETITITILSHGHDRGITHGTFDSLITWCELCEKINRLRTNFSLTLNLLAICNSFLIIPYKKTFGQNIDKIWVTTNTVNSINKGLLATQHSTFNDFIGNLDDEETNLYKEIL